MSLVSRVFFALSTASAAVACGVDSDFEASVGAAAVETAALEIQGDGFWAGLPSLTIARMPLDPCSNGVHGFDTGIPTYDGWARTRATHRNVCFEVWMPGVTDTENPDYWRLLNVQAHSRFVGDGDDAWKQEYVNAIDRRGNNRRYSWSFGLNHDPFYITPMLADVRVPFEILSEGDNYATLAAVLEVYFTVNGETLMASNGKPFQIRYLTTSPKPVLPVVAGGHVLHPEVVCGDNDLVVGGGAGYYAVDIRDPSAIAALMGDTIEGPVYAARASLSAQEGDAVWSIALSSRTGGDNGSLPSYFEGFYSMAPGGPRASLTADGDTMTLSVRAYDRVLQASRTLSVQFEGCTVASTTP